MAIALDTTLQQAESLSSAPVDQELVILNMATSHYLALDAIGRRIWDLLETPRRVDALCQQLSQEFAGTQERITADVLPFLDDLVQEGIVRVL